MSDSTLVLRLSPASGRAVFRNENQPLSKTFKIMDFRVGPPQLLFQILFDLKLRRLTWENKFKIPYCCGSSGLQTPAAPMSGNSGEQVA